MRRKNDSSDNKNLILRIGNVYKILTGDDPCECFIALSFRIGGLRAHFGQFSHELTSQMLTARMLTAGKLTA